MVPQYLPNAAAARIFQGDHKVLSDALARGLKTSILWPVWNAPLLHGICILSPPNAHLMVEPIMNAGQDPVARHNGLTPILCAIGGFGGPEDTNAAGRLALVSKLMEYSPSHDVALAARAAARTGFVGALERLVEYDPSLVEARFPDEGDTLLHEAARGPSKESFQFLLSKGARPRRNRKGKTPVDVIPATDRREREAIYLDVAGQEHSSDEDREPRVLRL